MKKTAALILFLSYVMISGSYADMEEHMRGHMMGSAEYEEPSGEEEYPYEMMNPGMMGYGGYGMMGRGMMNPGMMGYGGCGMMGPGMMYPGMMGRGMMNPGMMGYGGCGMMYPGMMGHHQMMHGMGPGMMRGYGIEEDYGKFLDETKGLRKELHMKKFEYREMVRKPDADRQKLAELEKEIWEIQKKIYKKWRNE